MSAPRRVCMLVGLLALGRERGVDVALGLEVFLGKIQPPFLLVNGERRGHARARQATPPGRRRIAPAHPTAGAFLAGVTH